MTAARLINRYGAIEDFPPEILAASAASRRCSSSTWRRFEPMQRSSPTWTTLRWRGPTDAFAAWAEKIGDAKLLPRVNSLVK